MAVKLVEAFGDSLLAVQQVSTVCQYFNGALNAYLDKCLDIISCFDEFVIRYIPREDNEKANALAHQSSGYNVSKKYFNIRKPMRIKAESLVLDEPVRPVVETGLTAPTGLTGPETSLTAEGGVSNSSAEIPTQNDEAEVQDWRVPIVAYLKDPGRGAERNIRRLAFKYVLIDDELYHRTADDVLLKCLGTDQARIAMGEVHAGICGTHQSAPKMKRLLRRAGFYWPSMISDCFRYYKGCEECQQFGDIQLVPALWPFKGWGLDFIGQINPPSKGYRFVLVATDYFTTWTEAVPYDT
jgi:hypothetical protein